ncbi:MAG: LysR family transcriptional regulator [Chloroflexota bacterium]|nr:LysR family transcriptional regulator [Chloroflexota bacterium]
MENRQLEAFLHVVQYQSFSRAAEVLDLTQPSLSARIISLEKEIGEPLFQRLGRGVRLTEAGRAFQPYVERSLGALKEAIEAVDATHRTSIGKLRIGSARAICAYVLPGILEVFHKTHPGVDIAIKTGRSSEVLDMVLSEDVHIGLTRHLAHQDIESRHLYNEHVVLVTHPSHRFVKDGAASIYDIAHEPLILYDKESTYFVLINRVVREAGIVPNVQMDLDSIEATKRMIERGLGVSFLPYNSILTEIEQGSLATIPIKEGYNVDLPTSVMVQRTLSHGAVVGSFLDLLYSLYPIEDVITT